MIDFLVDNPFVLLFLVLGIGFLLGKVRVGGFGLGVSAVLFVGLAFGALSARITVPDFVYQLGLVLFVYTVGVSAGPGFLITLRRRALGANLAVVLVLSLSAALASLLGHATGMSHAATAGMYTGATTNTPALAALLQQQAETHREGARALTDPVLGYSVAYPFGVLGMLIAVWGARRLWGRTTGVVTHDELTNLTALVTASGAAGMSPSDLMREHGWTVVLSRVRRGDDEEVLQADFILREGDQVVVVGPTSEVDRMAARLGVPVGSQLPLDRTDLDARRMFVSATEPIGQRIVDLRLAQRFGAIITRVRRGDTDRIARPDMVLEPGDRVRVVASRNRMHEVTRFFGDSYRRLSEIDVASFSLGLVGGLLFGLVPVPLPGGGTFRLGMAGGPLVVGLVLGALERTGPITWQLPYNANLTLRQFGAVLFLGGVGIRSGFAFADTLGSGNGVAMLLVGGAVTGIAAFSMIGIGRFVLHVPVDVLCGILAGMQTQPAVLAFAIEQSGDDLPNTGYASVYPVATIAKIVLAQLLLVL